MYSDIPEGFFPAGGSPDYLAKVAQIESGGNPNAKNPKSSSGGLFQFTDATAKEYGLDNKFDPAKSTVAAQKLALDNAEKLQTALGRPPTDGDLYLAHQQGANGAIKLLTNPNKPVAALLPSKAIINNGGSLNMRAGDFASQWIAKLDGPPVEITSSNALTLPNQYSDIPEGFKAYSDVPDGFAPAEDNLNATPPGFLERLQSDFNQRAGKQGEISQKATNNEISQFSNVLQQTGQGAGLVGDVIKEGVMSLPEIVRNNVITRTAGQAAGKMADDFGLTSAFSLAKKGYNKLEQVAPEVAHDIAAVGQIASVVIPPALKGAQAAEAAGQGLVRAGETVARGANKLDYSLGKTIRPSASELKVASQVNYTKAAEKGGVLSPKFTNEFIDHAKSFGAKDKMAATIAGESPITSLADDLEAFRGQPMTLDRATAVDQALTERLDDSAFTDKNGVLNSNGRKVLEIKNRLRESIQQAADNGLVEGGREGIDAYKTAVKDWSAQSQISDIQRIVDRASYMDNPATALKTGFRNIAVNPGRLSKYPKAVQSAIKQAARDGDIANILRTEWGSRLISGGVGTFVGGMLGGPAGALAGAVTGGGVSRAARGGAEALQMNRVNKVIDTIASKSSLPSKRIPRSQITRESLQKAFAKNKKR